MTTSRDPAPPVTPPPTILVIDDSEQNRLILRRLFQKPGYRVVEAPDGPRGLDAALQEKPDCILLDLVMPGMSGFEVLERLQAGPETRELPVIILTAMDDDPESMERALVGGAVDYLTKPISPVQVLVRVRGAIERGRLQRELQDLRASFTSMLVHDLRTPVTALIGYVELLRAAGAHVFTDRHLRYMERIDQTCRRLLGLIGEILDLSKLEAGKLRLDREPVALSSLAAAVVEQLAPLAAQRGVSLGLRTDDPVGPVEADPGRLDQVLMNLVGNALKFTPAGGSVVVELRDLGDALELAVSDTGAGIPPEELPLLFQKFSQTEAGLRLKSGGTGLGLVICRHIVEAHGGRIWAESQVGQGSRFVVRLPRGQAS